MLGFLLTPHFTLLLLQNNYIHPAVLLEGKSYSMFSQHIKAFSAWAQSKCRLSWRCDRTCGLAALWSAGVHGLELLPDPRRDWTWGILTTILFRFTRCVSSDSRLPASWTPEFHIIIILHHQSQHASYEGCVLPRRAVRLEDSSAGAGGTAAVTGLWEVCAGASCPAGHQRVISTTQTSTWANTWTSNTELKCMLWEKKRDCGVTRLPGKTVPSTA